MKTIAYHLRHSVPLDPFSHPSRKLNRYQTNSPACIPSGVGRPWNSWNNTYDERHPRAVMLHDMTMSWNHVVWQQCNDGMTWLSPPLRPLSPQTVGRRHSANHCSLTKSMLWRQSPRHGRNTWTTSSWRRHLSWEGGQSGDGLTPHMTVADVMPT